jgi:hypothetical protein
MCPAKKSVRNTSGQRSYTTDEGKGADSHVIVSPGSKHITRACIRTPAIRHIQGILDGFDKVHGSETSRFTIVRGVQEEDLEFEVLRRRYRPSDTSER